MDLFTRFAMAVLVVWLMIGGVNVSMMKLGEIYLTFAEWLVSLLFLSAVGFILFCITAILLRITDEVAVSSGGHRWVITEEYRLLLESEVDDD